MLILGLLAAIAIPSFFNQRDKARDADAKVLVRTAQTAAETYGTDNQGSYTGVNPGALIAIEETLNEAIALAATSATSDTYTVTVDSETGNDFSISRAANGTVSLTCNTGGQDGCPTGGVWD
jgi:type II secretory pathway pseudopilin PulG